MSTYSYALIAAASVLILHVTGIELSFYRIDSPYDILMHIIGGVAIALFVLALIRSFIPKSGHWRLYIIIGTLVIGAAWEMFEVYFGITGHTPGTWLYGVDTVADLFNDTLGALAVILVCMRSNTAEKIYSHE